MHDSIIGGSRIWKQTNLRWEQTNKNRASLNEPKRVLRTIKEEQDEWMEWKWRMKEEREFGIGESGSINNLRINVLDKNGRKCTNNLRPMHEELVTNTTTTTLDENTST